MIACSVISISSLAIFPSYYLYCYCQTAADSLKIENTGYITEARLTTEAGPEP